jgi:murein DD-endopeptidase MepM/ murein hydrolase activator NlpD
MTEADRKRLEQKGKSLKNLVEKHGKDFGCVIQPPLNLDNTIGIDLNSKSNVFAGIDPADADKCWEVLENELKSKNKVAGIGGYGEKRIAYRVNPDLYGNQEDERCIHIGVDVWMGVDTPIHAPLDATVHSFADNDSLGNYGPTIILQHELDGVHFYSLYGHLTRESLEGLEVGQTIKKGEIFTAIGSSEVNGNWPPHLHYQFIADMMGNEGDFIGVSTESEADFYLSLCPEPVVF